MFQYVSLENPSYHTSIHLIRKITYQKKDKKKSDLKRATVRESKTGCLQFYYTVCFRKCRPYRIYETIGTLHDVITDLF